MPDCKFPNRACIPTKVAVFDDSRSTYQRKCKRKPTIHGIVPCYCCPGECVGEPNSVAADDAFCRDFGDRMFPKDQKSDCPWAWTATLLIVFSIIVFCLKGVCW